MEIKVTKDNVCISNEQLHRGEFNVNPLYFTFAEEYTIDLVKKVVFTNQYGESYAETIINNQAIIPYEVLIEKGQLLIGVYAYEANGEELVLRYSPKPVYVTIERGSWIDAQDGTVVVPTLTVEQYEQALNEIIEKWTIDSEAIIQHIVTTSEAEFDTYYNGKLGAFNNNATQKTNDFDTNATNKTTTFDNNATQKQNTFDNNATQKTTTFDNNAIAKQGAFDSNATNKTTAYDNNAQAKVDYYDQHASEIIEMNELLLNAQPTNTATGETIHVTDSAKLPLANFEMVGNATQADTPTPTTPQAIHVVTGDVTIGLCAKNLAWTGWASDFATRINDTTKAEVLTFDNRSCVKWTASTGYGDYEHKYFFKIKGGFKTNTQYTFTFDTYRTNTQGNLVIEYTDGTIQNLGTPTEAETWQTKTQTSTANKTIKYIRARYQSGTGYIDINTFQCEEGTSATTYEAYQEQSVTLPLGDIELAKIGDYADRIYKDNGKWYVYKAIGKTTWNGTEDWTARYNSVYNHKMLFSTTCPHLQADGISTRFVAINGYTEYYPQGISFKNATNKLGLVLNDTILANYKASNLKAWLAENNTKVNYILPTPIITEITDQALITALEQVLAMTTYKTTTNGFTITVGDNATPTIVMEYRQDIGTLISNLNNAILSLGNNV